MVRGTSLLSTQMRRAGARGVELAAWQTGARRVPSHGSTSQAQHLGTVGRLGEVEGGGTTVPCLWERWVGPEHSRAQGSRFPHASRLWHPPTCICCMAWEAVEASSRVTVQPPKPPPVMRLP